MAEMSEKFRELGAEVYVAELVRPIAPDPE
jgi:hypothetical protein